MIEVRPSGERGHSKNAWLDSRHTFAFGDYIDPAHTHFQSLRVINQDIVRPNHGFESHEHKNMEIITYVLHGKITHEDSMGNKTVISPNQIQRMSAGTGITHSEKNEGTELVELLQIWIYPNEKNLTPSYEQLSFQPPHDGLLHLALDIHQGANIFTGRLNKNKMFDYLIPAERHAWMQLISGKLEINGVRLNKGDGAAISQVEQLKLIAREDCHFLLFDLS